MSSYVDIGYRGSMLYTAYDATDIGAAIRGERLRRGLTQSSAASTAGVSRQWWNKVEHGHSRAEIGKLLDVATTLNLAITLRADPVGGHTWLTAPEVARLIRIEVANGDDQFALRWLRRGLDDLRKLPLTDRKAYLAPAPSTGDHRWDTLHAAATARSCRHLGLQLPAWTGVEPLVTWWFPGGETIRRARVMQLTPIDLACRGIWLDGRALEAA